MILTAELSLYPLQTDYIPVIQALIDDLNQLDEITVTSNAMSTQIQGEHDAVMMAVSEVLRTSAQRHGGQQVLVCKFIPMVLGIGETASP